MIATVLIDLYSDLWDVFMQHDDTSAEISKAKITKLCGVSIHYSHADYGRFADIELINDIKLQQQTIWYCGVNANQQHRKAENRIRDTQVKGRNMPIQAIH